MAWDPFLWLVFFLMNMGLVAFNIYQIISLTDLQSDYLNAYEASSRINSVVISEYLLHGTFCILFLVTGHWFFFLVTLVPAYLNFMKFMKRQHLIDVTEVFRVLSAEIKLRVVKLALYLVLTVFIMIKLVFLSINHMVDDGEPLGFLGLF